MEASQVMLVVKSLSANAGDIRDKGSIHGLGRSPGGGHGNPLQYSCLENPMDKGAWQVKVYRVTKSWTQWKWLSTHARGNQTAPEKGQKGPGGWTEEYGPGVPGARQLLKWPGVVSEAALNITWDGQPVSCPCEHQGAFLLARTEARCWEAWGSC